MKTFKEFLEEVYLVERRREDKGKPRTPLYTTKQTKTLVKTPEGGWKLNKGTETNLSTGSNLGRFTSGKASGSSSMYGYATHAHGEGGINRGKKKREQVQPSEPTKLISQRRKALAQSKRIRTAKSPEELEYEFSSAGGRAAKILADKASRSFGKSSKEWNS